MVPTAFIAAPIAWRQSILLVFFMLPCTTTGDAHQNGKAKCRNSERGEKKKHTAKSFDI